MKKILSILAVALLIAVSFVGCNNKPAFVRLEAAVDSLNAQYDRQHNTDEKLITYDQWENVVHFHFPFPARIEENVFEPVAEHIKQNFLLQFLTDDEFGLATEVMDAKANVVIKIEGQDETSYEILIPTEEIASAYETLHADANGSEPVAATAEDADLQEEQHELTEGDVTTL